MSVLAKHQSSKQIHKEAVLVSERHKFPQTHRSSLTALTKFVDLLHELRLFTRR